MGGLRGAAEAVAGAVDEAAAAAAAAGAGAGAAAPPATAVVATRAAERNDHWDALTDPESGGVWCYNMRTGEASWSRPSPQKPISSDDAQGSAISDKRADVSLVQATT